MMVVSGGSVSSPSPNGVEAGSSDKFEANGKLGDLGGVDSGSDSESTDGDEGQILSYGAI